MMTNQPTPAAIDSEQDDERFAELLEVFGRIVAEAIAENDDQKVEAFLQLHGDQQARLRKLLPTMRAMAAIRSEAESREPAFAGTALHEAIFDGRPLGDFRVLRELGRGGMGIVYEARQISINRRVALKILPLAAVMDPRHVLRFKNEVQAAALLQHQNIVPVYSLGCDHGIHYYAMQYVEGHTLAEIIASLRSQAGLDAARPADGNGRDSKLAEVTTTLSELKASTPARGDMCAGSDMPAGNGKPVLRELAADASRGSEPAAAMTLSNASSSSVRDRCRAAAKLIIQAAEALDHAHQRGVLHRDIKPANLMVDTTGNLWVTDFGLARLEADAGTTMTGQIVGTLRYMSPEQALARRVVVDHRTDIYSLGATLFELCTLQAVYITSDRQELLKQIAFEEPRSMRKIDPRIPRELETITFKSISKNPTDRYDTAQELADDLRRYLDQRPILAKPPSPGDRVRKWSRRNWRAIIAATAVVLVGLVASLVGLSLHSSRLNGANRALENLNAELVTSRDETRELLYLADMRLAFDAWDRRRFDELQSLLDRHKPRRGETDVRGSEWNLLASLTKPPQPVTFLGHVGPVREIAMVPGREEFVSVGDDGTIRHWSILPRKLLRTIETESENLHAVAISSDGKWLATGNPTLQLWDFVTGEKLRDLSRIDYTLESIAFAPHGESIAAGWRHDEVRVVALDGEERARLPTTLKRNETLEFSHDGQTLFVPLETEERHVIRQLQVDSPGEWSDLEGGKSSPLWSRLTVSHDDLVSAVVSYTGGTVHLIENATARQIGVLGNSAGTIRALDFAPHDEGLAWGSDDGVLRVAVLRHKWPSTALATLQQVVPRVISAHARKITDVEYLTGDRVLTCSEDGSIKLWNMLETDVSLPMELPNVSTSGIAFSPDGHQIAVPCADGRVWFGSAVNGRSIDSVRIGDHGLEQIVYFPDGSGIVVGDADGTVTAWNQKERRVVAQWNNPDSAGVRALAIASQGGHIASATADQLLRIHDAESLSVLETISAPANVKALDFSPDGSSLAWGGSFSELFVHETSGWTQTHRISTRSALCQCVAFANEADLLASGHENGSIQIIDSSHGRMLQQFASGASVQSIAWSPDARLLVSTHRDGTQRVWHVSAATALGILHRDAKPYGTTRFSPDGSRLATVFTLGEASRGILWKLND
jgi:serine/threonine protein kinase/WD40 repeat protein